MVPILISRILISSIAGASLASSISFVLGPACRLGMTLFTTTGTDCVPGSGHIGWLHDQGASRKSKSSNLRHLLREVELLAS